MKCETVILPDGMTAIVCRSKPRVRKCGSCHSAPGMLLCDWKDAKRKSGTCDAPICPKCAKEVAPDKHLCVIHQVAYRAWLAALTHARA